MENFIYLKMKLKSKSLSRVIEWTILKVSQCCVDWGGDKQISFGAHLFGIFTFMVALVQTGLPLKNYVKFSLILVLNPIKHVMFKL